VASLAIFVVAMGAAWRARRVNVATGREAMIGADALVLGDFVGHGSVRAFGEVWQARSAVPVSKDQKVRVAGIDGLVLIVEPKP
jgi:membrane-bound serine protease (ClpP class)